ncbi:hypothetical protein [Erythrobacter sp.]|uniref:hypothetical protein n=1 Tax=Erythrobacter sp. TaxID=1042 RepID=UPI0025E6F85D|nr:hypothetical protein [Erythrobacter sp.]
MTRRSDPRTARLPVRDIVAQGELLAFTPVPRQCERHDGWTPQRQRTFIEALADTGSVAAACKTADMSQAGAYHLRRQPGADEFRAAWQRALDFGVQRIEDVAMDRALNGVEEPLYSYGALIGTRTRYNDRLLMFMLRNRAPERFADGRRVSGMGGLNAVGAMQVERLKKQWREEWEAQQSNVSCAEVQASIDRKITAMRRRIEAKQAAQWAKLSEETREAWTRFVALRERDLDAQAASEAARALVNITPLSDGPWSTPPGPYVSPEPEPPKTEWTLKDEGFDP